MVAPSDKCLSFTEMHAFSDIRAFWKAEELSFSTIVSVLDRTEHQSPLQAIRRNVPELGYLQVNPFEAIDTSALGTLICFQTQKESVVGFKQTKLTTHQLKSIFATEGWPRELIFANTLSGGLANSQSNSTSEFESQGPSLTKATTQGRDSKEIILEFVMRRERYRNHLRNFVGEADRVYLAIFACHHGSKIHLKEVEAIAASLNSCLSAATATAQILYFTGKFRLSGHDFENFGSASGVEPVGHDSSVVTQDKQARRNVPVDPTTKSNTVGQAVRNVLLKLVSALCPGLQFKQGAEFSKAPVSADDWTASSPDNRCHCDESAYSQLRSWLKEIQVPDFISKAEESQTLAGIHVLNSKFGEYWRATQPCPRFVKDEPEQLSQIEAIRQCIPELKSVSNHSSLDADSLDPGCLDQLGSLICFKTQNGSIVDIKEMPLCTKQLQSLLLSEIPELRKSSCQEYVRNADFQENLAILKANLWRYVEELDPCLFDSRPDDDEHKVFSRIEEREIDATKLIELISAGNLKYQFMNLFSLACTLQNLKNLLIAAGVSTLSVSKFDFPQDIVYMTDNCFQGLISQHKALRAEMQKWQAHSAGFDAFTKCRDEREECSFVMDIITEPRLLAAAVDQRPDLKEDILGFAMQKEAFCNHIRNFVGEWDRVYLAVFSSQQASKVCSGKVAAIEERLRSCLGLNPAAVTVLYFTGTYTRTCQES